MSRSLCVGDTSAGGAAPFERMSCVELLGRGAGERLMAEDVRRRNLTVRTRDGSIRAAIRMPKTEILDEYALLVVRLDAKQTAVRMTRIRRAGCQ